MKQSIHFFINNLQDVSYDAYLNIQIRSFSFSSAGRIRYTKISFYTILLWLYKQGLSCAKQLLTPVCAVFCKRSFLI